jgi:hypothetical protein
MVVQFTPPQYLTKANQLYYALSRLEEEVANLIKPLQPNLV